MKAQNLTLIMGIISILCGVLAFINPMGATIILEQFIAWLFVMVGSVQLAGVLLFRYLFDDLGSPKWLIFLGLLVLLIGIYLLINPLQGSVALAVIVACFFLISGMTRILFAFAMRKLHKLVGLFFIPTFLSGLLSLALAIMLFFDFPQPATSLLGIFLGIELVSNGINLAFLSRR